MSYLLDKKNKRRKLIYFVSFLFAFLILFYFRLGIWNGLSYVSHKIFRPVLVLGNFSGGKFGSIGAYFSFKSSLSSQNEILQTKLSESEARTLNYNSLLQENSELKEVLARKGEKASMTLAAILGRPNQNLYDTLIIDVGLKQGMKVGETVFALGDVPIGRVSDVYDTSSKVILFSNSGEKTQGIISSKPAEDGESVHGDVFVEVLGRGGGNFEIALPRDFTLEKGDEIVLPGIVPYVLATVSTVISDLRDPLMKALLVSPVNMREIKFVQVAQ